MALILYPKQQWQNGGNSNKTSCFCPPLKQIKPEYKDLFHRQRPLKLKIILICIKGKFLK
ncbi:hypothetical protein HZS_7438 [Henneguya salminicola]|nr:hypothetical protein HZS_7438 [Henneguya salminicola]